MKLGVLWVGVSRLGRGNGDELVGVPLKIFNLLLGVLEFGVYAAA